MNRFPDDLNTLLGIIRDCRDHHSTIDIIHQRNLYSALDRLEASAHELDAMLDVHTVMTAGGDNEPYSLYRALNGMCDALMPSSGEDEKLDVRQLHNNLIRCRAMAESMGGRLQMAEAMLTSQTEAAKASGENVVSLSEWRT